MVWLARQGGAGRGWAGRGEARLGRRGMDGQGEARLGRAWQAISQRRKEKIL